MARSVSVSVLITAAGSSSRFSGANEPISGNQQSNTNYPKKEFVPINGVPVLVLTVKAFIDAFGESNFDLLSIMITCKPGQIEQTRSVLDSKGDVPVYFIEGGKFRQASVLNGLEALNSVHAANLPDVVLIHDGSRPWVSTPIILTTVEAAYRCGGSAPVVHIVDSLKSVDEHGFLIAHHDREKFRAVQTPQTFRFTEILSAHRKAVSGNSQYADDTEIFCDWGGTVTAVAGDIRNRKITYPSDIAEDITNDTSKSAAPNGETI